jgi:hypothetical protein
MKSKILLILLTGFALIWSSCKKHEFAEGDLSPITSIQDVRNLYSGTDVTLNKENLTGATQIVGIVISDQTTGNSPAGVVVLQGNRRKKIRGISLVMANAAEYKPGDSLIVSIDGSVLTKTNGSLQITGLSSASITKVSSDKAAIVQTVSSYTINSNPGNFENTLVQIKGGTLNPQPVFGAKFVGDHSIVNGGDSIILHTETIASFADELLPASATFTGVLFLAQSSSGAIVSKVWPRSIADVTDVVAPVNPDGPALGISPVVITGYVNDAKGADGNYEYAQFLATKAIDFEKTPMSVVTCTNAGTAAPNAGAAPGSGWATGGGRTYKFNLTSGTVAKGEFFYVGGINKKINGQNSTDISSSKWIRAIQYSTTDGDGFGSLSGGLLPNSGNAGGIAIFEGINVIETSVPVDAVFFGGVGKTTIFDAVNNKGYRIPDNDRYSSVDPTSGAEQPFLYQGSNAYVITFTTADIGDFVKLGGNFDAVAKKWITPRTFTHYTMSATSTLTEIEAGSNVTTLSN